jgi:hypothetical protein
MPDAKRLASFFAFFVETSSGRSILKGNSYVPRSDTFRQDCRPKQHRRDDRADPRSNQLSHDKGGDVMYPDPGKRGREAARKCGF